MPADRSDAACTVAGVRKPSMKEPAGNGRRWRRERRALWRFADAGPAARGTVIMGRHPKTFTTADIASYSITSSARARSVGGITQPPSSLSCLALK